MKEKNFNRPDRRILLVTHKTRWNGEAEYSAGLIEAELKLGYKVTLIAPDDCVLARRFRDRVSFFPLPGLRPSVSPLDFFKDIRFISRLLATGDYDLVHSSRSTSHLLTALAVRKKIPFLHVRSGAKNPYGHPGNRFLYRGLTDGVIVSSARIKKWLVEGLGMDPGRIHQLLLSVDTDFYRPAPPDPELFQELELEPDRPLVLNVARLAPVKGHDVLVKAMTAVVAQFPRAVLVLVGRPWQNQPGRLLRQARSLGIEKSIIFPGPRDDVRRFIWAASVCVSSSIGSEVNSRAVSEYMAGGKPVVVTRVGVMPELVEDGISGRVVPPRDPGALAAAIREILSDPARAREMGEEGRRAAQERFSEEIFARDLKEVLDQAIAVPSKDN